MPISSSLYTSFAGLQNSDTRISVTSQNITNADKAGYTRKELETQYTTTNAGTVPIGGLIETINFDPFLLETLIEDVSVATNNQIISDFLSRYVGELGSTDGQNSLSAFLDNLSVSIDRLSVTPEDASLKAGVIDNAEILARELNRLSASIQGYRLQVDQQIERTVNQLNISLQRIDELNDEIFIFSTTGQSTSNLEDERRVELEKVAEFIDIEYFTNNQNQLSIYSGGRPLLVSSARTLNYTANTALSKTTLYPAGFSPIDLDGTDITLNITGGELGGLIELRDNVFVNEQSKLDEFANVLSRELNAVLNTGASFPSRSTLLGDVTGVNAADPLTGTGTFRIATLDGNGVVQNFADFNVAGYATVNDFIVDVNATLGPDVTVSILPPDNQIQIVANNAGEGLAINELTSSINPDSQGMSDFFGLNGLFAEGAGADTIRVSDYLINNTEFLAAGQLSNNALLAIGDVGVTPGNSTVANNLRDAITTPFTFNAAGNFAAQTQSIDNYIDNIIADAAFAAENAADNASIANSLRDETTNSIQNLSGVNIDEELAVLVDLQAKYEASATMISTLQELFDSLLRAVR